MRGRLNGALVHGTATHTIAKKWFLQDATHEASFEDARPEINFLVTV